VLDVGLAGFALILVGLSAAYTKIQSGLRRRRRWWKTDSNVVCRLIFLLIGSFLAYNHGGWPEVIQRVFNWRILAAFCCYLPWALMQQALLQFYLLGRLLALFPKRFVFVPMIITGTCIVWFICLICGRPRDHPGGNSIGV